MSARRLLAPACATAVLTTAGLLAPLPALASGSLGQPTGVHVVSVARHGFTVALKKTANAKRYRLFASTNKSDLYVAHISHAIRSPLSSKPRIAISGLHYSTLPYWYRVAAINGSHIRYSATVLSVGLKPLPPTSVSVHDNYLTWTPASATGYRVTQATDAAMSQNRVNYTLRSGLVNQFTPYGLGKGQTYYFQVRSLNSKTRSRAASGTFTLTPSTSEQAVRVLQYNVLEATGDGRSEGGNTVAPWWQHRDIAAAKLIKQEMPDVAAIEEAASWAKPNDVKGPRMIDDLVSILKGMGLHYALAYTEVPPTQQHYFRTGQYVIYNTDVYSAVGQGDHWTIPYPSSHPKYAAYQILRNKTSGAEFLMVSVHLLVGATLADDKTREKEVQNLLAQSQTYDRQHGNLPIVYAGDYNSHTAHKNVQFDGPGAAMHAAHQADAWEVAQRMHNQAYDSANEYMTRPPKFGYSIDHIYVSPGVGIKTWDLVLDLQNGAFVGTIPSDHNPLVSDLYYAY